MSQQITIRVSPVAKIIFFTAIGLIVAFFMYIAFIGPAILHETAKSWPLTSGYIVSADETGTLVNHNPEVKFEINYLVDGVKRTSAANEVVSQFDIPQVQPRNYVPVRYNPKNPDQIVIDLNCSQNQIDELNKAISNGEDPGK